VLQLLAQTTYPSYGYMLAGGEYKAEPATTLWELWHSSEEGPGMNSRNHIMFGSVGSWFYKSLLGVVPTKPGYASLAIHPTGVLCAGCNLTAATGTLSTPHGPVVVGWQSRNASVNLTVTVPIGTNATVAVPAPANASITEGGAAVWKGGKFVPGVSGISSAKAVAAFEPYVEFEVASGSYAFVSVA